MVPKLFAFARHSSNSRLRLTGTAIHYSNTFVVSQVHDYPTTTHGNLAPESAETTLAPSRLIELAVDTRGDETTASVKAW